LKSGSYWIQLSDKQPEPVYCDMETDNGGWTLFLNYVHTPGNNLILNQNVHYNIKKYRKFLKTQKQTHIST